MTKEEIDLLVNQTIETINTNLNQLNPPVSDQQINDAFNDPIKNAFAHVYNNSEDKNNTKIQVYKKLALKVHPDRLKLSDEACAVNMRRLDVGEAIKIPHQILEYHKNNNFVELLGEINTNPVEATQAIITRLSSYNEYLRYPEPIKSFVLYSRYVIFAGAAITGLVSMVGLFSVAIVNQFVEKNLLNFVTGNHYEDELNKAATPEKMAELAREFLLNLGIDASEDTNENAVERYIAIRIELYRQLFGDSNAEQPRLSREQIVAVLKESIKNRISKLAHLNAVYNAFTSAISKPFSEGFGENIISLLLRMAQATLMIPCLILDAVKQFVDIVIGYLQIATLAVTALTCIAAILVTNIPLYIYDGLPVVANWMGDAANATAEAATSAAHSVSRSYGRMFSSTASGTPVLEEQLVLHAGFN